MTEPKGIDDVAPAGAGMDDELLKKDDLAGKPMLLTGGRLVPKGANGPWWKISATLEDGTAVTFSGATVLDQQIKTCVENGVLPPTGPGVRAMLVKEQPDGGNAYWKFVTPTGVGPRIDAAGQPATNGGGGDRVAQVKRLMGSHGVTADEVRQFIDALEGVAPGTKVTELGDEDYATLLEFMQQEVPF